MFRYFKLKKKLIPIIILTDKVYLLSQLVEEKSVYMQLYGGVGDLRIIRVVVGNFIKVQLGLPD